MANPAFATLFNPPKAATEAVARLKESALALMAEGMIGKDLRMSEWITIVDVGRVLPETPSPGRLAPLLRASARVATRSAEILQRGITGEPLTTGERQALVTASRWARAARTLLRQGATIEGPEFDPLFTRINRQRWARLLDMIYCDIALTMREHLRVAEIDWTDNSHFAPIRCDSDGSSAIDHLGLDPQLYGASWDIEVLAERLAAGVEVQL